MAGYSPAAAAAFERAHGGGTVERIMASLVWPRAVHLAVLVDADPVEIALDSYNALQTCGPGRLLRYATALHHADMGALDHARRLFEAERAGRLAQRPARGTRSTRRHRKRRSGRSPSGARGRIAS